VTLTLSLPLVLSSIPFRMLADLAGFYTSIVRVFQDDNLASTWLAFALGWLACAAAVMASSCLVFGISEIRKRLFER
jgi:hypothetical protein